MILIFGATIQSTRVRPLTGFSTAYQARIALAYLDALEACAVEALPETVRRADACPPTLRCPASSEPATRRVAPAVEALP